MASGGCDDAFVALMDCVAAAAAVKDGSGTPPTSTQPLPCLDAADSLRKCMEANAGKYAHTLDLIGAGAGEGEADANNNANRGLVLEVMNMQEAYVVEAQKAVAETEMEIGARESKACKDAMEALKECVAGLVAGGLTRRTLPLSCLEAEASLEKCMEAPCSTASLPAASAGEGEVDPASKIGV